MRNTEFKIRFMLAGYQDTLALLNYCTINKENEPLFSNIPSKVQDALSGLLFSKFMRNPNVFADNDAPDEDYRELVETLSKSIGIYGEDDTAELLLKLRKEMEGARK